MLSYCIKCNQEKVIPSYTVETHQWIPFTMKYHYGNDVDIPVGLPITNYHVAACFHLRKEFVKNKKREVGQTGWSAYQSSTCTHCKLTDYLSWYEEYDVNQ